MSMGANPSTFRFIEFRASITYLGASVTRLGNLLDFGQIFKAFGKNLICPNLPRF